MNVLLFFKFLRNLGGHDIVQQDDATYRLVMNTFLIKQPSSTISASHFSSPSSHSPSCVAPREVTETSTKTSKTTQLSSSAIQTKVKQYKTTPPKEPPSGTPIHPTQIASSTLPTFTSSLQPYPCLSTSSSSPTLSNIPDEETLIVLSNKKDKKGNSVHEMFDCSKSSWSEWITKGNMEWGLEAQVVRKTLVCMGGFGAHGKKVNLYDFSKNWISGPDMNFPRFVNPNESVCKNYGPHLLFVSPFLKLWKSSYAWWNMVVVPWSWKILQKIAQITFCFPKPSYSLSDCWHN